MDARDTPSVPGLSDLTAIGSGGFATVYRARDETFGRQVAVKVLGPHASDDALRRFTRECRAIGAVDSHPHIVTVHQAGQTDDGRPYLVMAHEPGGSLQERIDAGVRFAPAQVAAIGAALASALATAHAAGVLHRDVKPANVLLSSDGSPKLADFGIASLVDVTHSRSGSVTASLAHAPPEQVDGRPALPAGDVYSLGSTLATLLLGHPPFVTGAEDHVAALLARIALSPPPDLQAVGAPPGLAGLIQAMMAKQPEARPPLSVIQEGLRAVASGQAATGSTQVGHPAVGTVGPPASQPNHPNHPGQPDDQRWRPPPAQQSAGVARGRRMAPVLAGIVLLAAGLVGWALWPRADAGSERDPQTSTASVAGPTAGSDPAPTRPEGPGATPPEQPAGTPLDESAVTPPPNTGLTPNTPATPTPTPTRVPGAPLDADLLSGVLLTADDLQGGQWRTDSEQRVDSSADPGHPFALWDVCDVPPPLDQLAAAASTTWINDDTLPPQFLASTAVAITGDPVAVIADLREAARSCSTYLDSRPDGGEWEVDVLGVEVIPGFEDTAYTVGLQSSSVGLNYVGNVFAVGDVLLLMEADSGMGIQEITRLAGLMLERAQPLGR